MGLTFGGLKSLVQSAAATVAQLVGQDIVAKSITLTQSSGANAVTLQTTGARLKLSSAGTTDYLTGDGASTVQAQGIMRAVSRFALAGQTTDPTVCLGSFLSLTADALGLRGGAANGATAVGVAITNFPNLTTAGAQICAFYPDNATTKVAYVDISGTFVGGMGTSAGSTPVTQTGTINTNTTAVGNVGGGTDDLITYALPASSLTTTGRGVRITAWGTGANNANAKTLTLNFGSQVIMTQALTTAQADTWRIQALVLRTGTDTQDVFAELLQTGTTSITKQTLTAGTQTESGAITIKCTGAATADNDIVQEGLLVESL